MSDKHTTMRIVKRSYIELHRQLVPGDLHVVFQPLVDLRTGTTFAYEALVRWKAERAATPDALFAHALEGGYVGRLGRMIRERALADAPATPLFLNLHPHELQERWLVQPDDPIYLHDAQVYLEITESAPLTHFDLCTNVLREVCARSGALLVVDDLGAGYSNFKRIIELEPHVVKLDRELIRNVDEHPRQQRLVSGVIALCSQLGAKVVAEGIETEAELSAMIDAGAELGQGYFLGRPAQPPRPSQWRPPRAR